MTYALRGPRLAIAIGIVVVAVIVAFLLLGGDDDSSSDGSQPQATDGPEAASLDRLRDLANSVDHPVYWAGEEPGGEYELTVQNDGKIYIRYLPQGTPVGSRKASSLTIGTYPFSDAFGTLQEAAQQPGAIVDQTPDGGLVVSSNSNPNNVYVAYPGSDYQIEIFDPDAKTALGIATSGAIEPIE
jgi:hypothetical protein